MFLGWNLDIFVIAKTCFAPLALFLFNILVNYNIKISLLNIVEGQAAVVVATVLHIKCKFCIDLRIYFKCNVLS